MKNWSWLLVLLITASCNKKLDGTNTGNPVAGDASPSITTATSLVQKICLKINACNASITYETCYDKVIGLNNYTSELGTISITYSTMASLSTAEANGAVTANSTNSISCESAISALICSDSLVKTAFSLSSPTDFTKTNYLFRASSNCTHIY